MNIKQAFVRIVMAGLLTVSGVLLSSVGHSQDAKVKTAMELLRSMADKLGQPKIDGPDIVAGKQVPAIYFGPTKLSNNFDLVDEVVKQPAGRPRSL